MSAQQWIACGWVVALLGGLASDADCEEIRDYYAEPGLQPVGVPDDQGFGDGVDPFSGTLQLSYTDIVVPGPGGLDIVVNRSYISPRGVPGIHHAFAMGWTLHFGRIVVPSRHASKVCTQQLWSVTTADNPSIERPDGSRELLVLDASALPVYRLITKSNWTAECIGGATGGLRVHSPEGRTYEMNVIDTSAGDTSWYVSAITDLDGNKITVIYATNPTGIKYVQSVARTDSSGTPILVFDYDDIGTSNIRLKSITVESGPTPQVWTYGYVATGVAGHFQLTRVVRPDGKSWAYDYFPVAAPPHESLALRKIIHPYGGVIQYTYDKVFFGSAGQPDTPVVKTKAVSGPAVTPGTWTYTYAPGGATIGALAIDRTTVTTPVARIEYDYYGYKGLAGSLNSRWLIGLLIEQRTYAPNSSTPLEKIQQQWDGRLISSENYWHGRGEVERDNDVYAPRNVQTSVFRSSWFHTYYQNFDRFGNPTTIRETTDTTLNITGSSNFVIPPERVRTIQYYNDVANGKWVIGKLDKQTTTWTRDAGTGAGTQPESTIIDNQFLPDARVAWTEQDGVRTSFSYHPTGDLHTETNALGFVTTYLNYYRGIPQQEIHPLGTTTNYTLRRTVNGTGTVASLTDGRGFTKSFLYDSLNRLQQITYPRAGTAPVNINRAFASQRQLKRGNFQLTDVFDGFGRTVQTLREDVSDVTRRIVQNFEFDAVGRATFVSNPDPTSLTDGDRTSFDAIGRKIRVIHSDATVRSWQYQFPNWVREVNERGFEKTQVSVAYGAPDNVLALIEVRELKARPSTYTRTIIWPNLRGQPIRLLQGEAASATAAFSGALRSFKYNPRYFLTHESHPDLGEIDYVTDALGNVKEKWWGGITVGKRIALTYDRQNRVQAITYPTMDSSIYPAVDDLVASNVTYDYDANGNVIKLTKGTGVRNFEWLYGFDANNNLLSEKLSIQNHTLGLSSDPDYAGTNPRLKRDYAIQARTFLFNYSFDTLDHMATMRYPSGLSVEYRPDALGRPTKVRDLVGGTNFASNVLFAGTGALRQYLQGNGLTTTQTLHRRRWVQSIRATAAGRDALNLTYTYDPHGNVDLITDPVGDMDIDPAYDGLDQLTSASGPWGTVSYRYGPSGEVSQRVGPNGKNRNFFYRAGAGLEGVSDGTQFFSYRRDQLGNLSPFHTFTTSTSSRGDLPLFRETDYDGASNLAFLGLQHLVTVSPEVEVQYVYDGANHRTLEVRTDSTQAQGYRHKYTVYGKGGQLLYEDEVENICPLTREYIRLGDTLLAQKENQPDTDTDKDGRSDCFEKSNGLDPFKDDATLDTDNDGLSDLLEWQLGLKKNRPDSDNDGLDDGYEYARRASGMDPLKYDSDLDPDHDGLPTLVEARFGSNPLLADSDADGIPDAYELHNQGLKPSINDASTDLDADGVTNLQEYGAGSWASLTKSLPSNVPTQIGQPEWQGALYGWCSGFLDGFGGDASVSSWGQTARLSKGRCYPTRYYELKLELRGADGNFFKIRQLNYGTKEMLSNYRLHAPTYFPNGQLIVADGRYVTVFDPNGARVTGDHMFGSDGNYLTGPAALLPDRRIVIATDNGTISVAQLENNTGRHDYSLVTRWQQNIGASIATAPLVTSTGNIVVGTTTGELVTLDASGRLLSRRLIGGTLFKDSLSRGPNGAVIVAANGLGYRKFSALALANAAVPATWTFNVAATSTVSQALVDAAENYYVAEATDGALARISKLLSTGVSSGAYDATFLGLGGLAVSLQSIAEDGRLYACVIKGNEQKCWILSSTLTPGKLTVEHEFPDTLEIIPVRGNAAYREGGRTFERIRIPNFKPSPSTWPTVGGGQ